MMTIEFDQEKATDKVLEGETDEVIPLSDEESALLERLEQAETEEEQLAIELLLIGEDTDAGLHGDEEEASQEREVADGNS